MNVQSKPGLAEKTKELAALTGEEPEVAAEVAVSERLARLRPDRQERIERLRKLALHCADNLTGPPITSADIDTNLYDPYIGAPR